MDTTLLREIEQLRRASIAQLRERHRELFGEEPRTHHREALFRRVAWRLQAKYHLERGEIVYDPFLGSGTTLLAAEGLERICYGIEIGPCYVDVAIERWQKTRGETAVLAANNCSYEEMRTRRGSNPTATPERHAA